MTDYLRATESGYDAERTGYNLAVRHEPAVIVPASSAADVVAAVRYATSHGLGVAVQATGHGPSRPADGQVLITTSGMAGITVDPDARTARVEAGVLGGGLVAAAAEHGLAPVNGSAPGVGVVSYVLGGGLGILGRSLGWAVDHVRAIEIVTADGRLHRVTAAQGPDLFWALRGAGKGNLGVVAALEMDLHPIARIYGGGMHFAAETAEQAVATWARWTRKVPETMNSSVLLIRMPDLPVLPEELRGRYVVHIRFAFTGTATEGERLVRPFRELGPVTDTVSEMPYSEVGSIHAEPNTPVPFHARNLMLRDMPVAAIAELMRHAGPRADAPYLVELRHAGGALARPGTVPSALARRDGEFVFYAGGAAEAEQAPALQDRLAEVVSAMRPWSTGGVCVNFLSGPDVTAAELASGYLAADIERLERIKATVDPQDVFRTHHGRV